MVHITEAPFDVPGASLHSKTWMPDGPVKAKMIMIHGFSDHIDRYYEFFPTLAARGIAVYGVDQRGWGKSVKAPAEKGKTGPTDQVLQDMVKFISDKMAAAPAEAPTFVLGHSMGGGQTAMLASSPEHADLVARVRGFILEAPFIGFAPELAPSWLLVTSGRLAAKVLPNMHLKQPIPPEDVSRDPEVQQSIRDDALLHYTGTLQGLDGMLIRTDALSTGKAHLLDGGRVRALFLAHGTADKATSFDASKAWFERQKGRVAGGDAEFKAYDGMYHQMHADTGKEEFYKDVGDWILARSGDEATPESKL